MRALPVGATATAYPAQIAVHTTNQDKKSEVISPVVTTSINSSSGSFENKSKGGLISLPALVDSVLRAGFRFIESTKFANPLTGTAFRLGSEIVRHGTTGTVKEAIENKPVTKKVFVKSLRDALENTLGRIAFNTNTQSDNPDGSVKQGLGRVVKGFGNMVVRVAYRVALATLNVIDPSEIEATSLVDEFASKSLSRALCVPIDSAAGGVNNAVLGIGSRALEQGVIPSWLEKLPLQHLLFSGKSA